MTIAMFNVCDASSIRFSLTSLESNFGGFYDTILKCSKPRKVICHPDRFTALAGQKTHSRSESLG